MHSCPAVPRVPLLLVLLALAGISSQADEPEFCVGGIVLNAVTGAPLSRAAVIIPESAALTDAGGAFRFCRLPAGSYYVSAEKPRFAEAYTRVVIGPSREDVVLRLQPLSAIAGKVVDANGEPVEHATIQLISSVVTEGRRHVRLESTVPTDDRGQYRLAGFLPGRYYVRAAGWEGSTPHPDAHETFAPVYYGGAADISSAAPVTIERGRDLRADFSVDLRPGYRIGGAIAGFSPLLPGKIELLAAGGEPSGAPVALDAATGRFQIDDVAPGRYILRATQGEDRSRRRGEVALEVTRNTNGVVVALTGSVVLRGVVRMAASEAAPPPPNCMIRLSPADVWIWEDAALEAATEPSGGFEIEGVLAGRYRLRMDCPNGYLSAVRMGEADLLANNELSIPPGTAPPPIEAVLASNGGTVDVTATHDGEPGPAWVLLLPASGNELHTRLAQLNAKLTLSGLAPGDYLAYAWTGSPEAFEYASPDVREAWAGRAVSVRVGEGDRQSVALRIASGEAP